MYALVMTIDHCYWERDCKCDHARQAEKEALKFHSWKQGKASTSGFATASQNKANSALAASSTKNSSPKLSPSPALSDSHSLFVSLTSPLILGQDHLNKILFLALIDSGSTYCFVDSEFVDTHHLKTSATSLVALHLFDGSSNSTISEIANLLIIFSTSDCMNLDFYVTPLDSSCSLVLGYNWLA